MSTRLAAASGAVTAVVLVAVWVTDLSFERAVLLAPVLVIGLAAVAGLVVFWGRVGWDSFRQARHPEARHRSRAGVRPSAGGPDAARRPAAARVGRISWGLGRGLTVPVNTGWPGVRKTPQLRR